MKKYLKCVKVLYLFFIKLLTHVERCDTIHLTKSLVKGESMETIKRSFKMDELVAKANAEYEKNGRSESFVAIEDSIVWATGYCISVFARDVKGADIARLEDAIIKDVNRNIDAIVTFANEVKGADIAKLEDAVIKKDELYTSLEFAKRVKGINIEKWENYFISGGIPYSDIVEFAKQVKGVNITKILDYLVSENYMPGIIDIASTVEGVNIEKLEDDIIANPRLSIDIIEFAEKVPGVNVSKIEDWFIETKRIYKISDFAKNVPGANVTKLEDALIEMLKDDSIDPLPVKLYSAREIVKFAKEVEGANISKLEDALMANVEGNNFTGPLISYICEFANEVEKANISKLQDFVIARGSYITTFARDVKKADVEKLEDALMAKVKGNNFDNLIIFSVCSFANEVKKANLSKIRDAIIARGNVSDMAKLATKVPKANGSKIQDAVVRAGIRNLRYDCIIEVANAADKAGVARMENAVIASGEAELISMFAKSVKGANKSKLRTALERIKANNDTDTFGV